jgi:hypothetical protein
MGLKPSPYNSIRMYLVTEEINWGDRHDPDNAFQYNYVMLNLPGLKGYKPLVAWISKRRSDGSLASNFDCFMDDQRILGEGRERVVTTGHAISLCESHLEIQDALRKLQAPGGSRRPGAWAGACVFNEEDIGIVTLTSQEKWDRVKSCCQHWHAIVLTGDTVLDYKKLRSNRGFMVYVMQAYPSLKPYLKGFHLLLKTWQGGQDAEGWKEQGARGEDDMEPERETETSVEELKLQGLIRAAQGMGVDSQGPSLGLTIAIPWFKRDLEALLFLSRSKEPNMRQVRSSNVVLTAYYGYGAASSGGFDSTVAQPGGLHGRCGLWPRDMEDQSSNYQELRNLVDAMDEEAKEGYLKGSELWMFTDNSTAESCFYKGGSLSELLHELVLWLRKIELDHGFILHVVHVSGMRMIAQGTDGLSRGLFLEGVMAGRDMLSYVNLAKGAKKPQPKLVDYVQSWVRQACR